MAMRSDGRIPVGLPFLAEPIAQRQIPKGRDGRPAGQGKLPCQRPDLRRTARPVMLERCYDKDNEGNNKRKQAILPIHLDARSTRCAESIGTMPIRTISKTTHLS